MQWEQWRNNSDALVAGPIPAGEYTTLPVALQPSDVALQGSFTDIPSLLKLNILEEHPGRVLVIHQGSDLLPSLDAFGLLLAFICQVGLFLGLRTS